MVKKIALFLALILISVSAMINAEDKENRCEIGLSFVKKEQSHVANKMFSGGELRTIFMGRGYFFDVQGLYMKKSAPSETEDLGSVRFKVELDSVSWWKWLVFSFVYNYDTETEKFHIFNQPDDVITSEQWSRNEIMGGLGFKAGTYNKSFIRIVGAIGLSQKKHMVNFDLIDFVLKDTKLQEAVVGGSLKGRLRVDSKNKKAASFWIDFQLGYNYYFDSRNYRAELISGLGIKLTKNFAVKSNIIGATSKYKNSFLRFGYTAGLVIIL